MKIKILIILSIFCIFHHDFINKIISEQYPTYDIRADEYQYKENFVVPYFQVEHMKSKELQKKINVILKENGYRWIKNYPAEDDRKNLLLCYKPEKPEITFQTRRYLSIKYKYTQIKFIEGLSKPVYYNCITIDMKTGKRVHLKELLTINQELIQKIKETEALMVPEPDAAMSEEDFKDFILNYEDKSLLNRLKQLEEDDAKTEAEYIAEDLYGNMGDILWKSTYNLTWDGISVNHTFGNKYQIIKKEEVKDFLYFDPWKQVW